MDIEAEKKREAAYWRERMNILAAADSKLSQQTYRKIETAFNLAQKDIKKDIDAWLARFAGNNGVSLAEARKLLNSQQLKEFRWDVKEYIKRGRQNAVNHKWEKALENASARLHISRLEQLQIQVQNHLENAFGIENKAVDTLVKDVYKNGYYNTAYEVQKGFNTGFNISGVDTKKLDDIAHKPWTVDSRTFSDRIWERKDKMVNQLHQEMIRNCIYGRSQKDMMNALTQYVQKDIKNAKYCAARVVRTETAYFSSISQRDSLIALGCERYEIDLPLTSNSCPICTEMNGKIFKMSEYEVGSTAPPFHPNCENGDILPYFDDEFGVDEQNVQAIPDDLPYEEWEKKFVKPEKGLTTTVVSDTIKENVVNNLRVEMSQGSLIEQHQRHIAADVTDEYLQAATPQIGKIIRDEGYNEKIHKNEIAFADWLHNRLGGKIKLLNEKPKEGISMPDYIWNGKLWDLKTATTEKSANGLIRKGLHQIESNPGGIFLDYGDRDISLDVLLNVIEERMKWYKGNGLDIMIVQNGEVLKVLRYEKREQFPHHNSEGASL